MAIIGVTDTAQSARDKALADQASSKASAKLSAQIASSETNVTNLSDQLAAKDNAITTQTVAVQNLQSAESPDTAAIEAAQKTLTQLKKDRDTLRTQLVAAQLADVNLKTQQNQSATLAVSTAAASVTTTALGVYGNTSSTSGGSLSYNASAVNEAYFSNKVSFIEDIQSPNNRPAAVANASQLWTSSSGSKGMIVTSEQVLKSWNSGSNKPQTANYFDNHNYGFQFQYNPGTVAMSYFTSPNVDVTMMTSGQEMFNLAGVSGSQGSVSFQVVINRILDMQYYDASGSLKANISGQDIYPVPPANTQDYTDLYTKGTMYDVEYLLRVLMGTTMSSYLRGSNTADMGWLPAIPVELHLGKTLRYLGTVNSVNLNHIIFDSRMVPLFTTMDIAFARLPDYPASGSTVTA